MARGRFSPDRHGYGYVLNLAPEVRNHCQLQGEHLAHSASTQSGADYEVDTRSGFTRFHTRVTMASRNPDGSWNTEFFREGHLRALPIALVQWGGKMGGFKLRPRPRRASKRGGR